MKGMKAGQLFMVYCVVSSGVFLVSYPQCEGFVKEYGKIDFEDYVFNGQENVGWLRFGSPISLKTVFYGQNDYRLVVVGDTQNYIFRVKIKDNKGNVLWDNIDHNMERTLDFTVERTRTLVIEVDAQKKDGASTTYSGAGGRDALTLAEGTCVGVFMGSRPTYRAGFKTTMSPKTAKEKVKRRYGK